MTSRHKLKDEEIMKRRRESILDNELLVAMLENEITIGKK